MKTTTLLTSLLFLSGIAFLTSYASSGLPVTSGYTVTTDASFFSGAEGQQSPNDPNGIRGRAKYTLSCTPLSGTGLDAQIRHVDVAPIWMEQ